MHHLIAPCSSVQALKQSEQNTPLLLLWSLSRSALAICHVLHEGTMAVLQQKNLSDWINMSIVVYIVNIWNGE